MTLNSGGKVTDNGTVTEQGYPHGVRCGECRDEITPGSRYELVPDPASADGTQYEHPVCLSCNQRRARGRESRDAWTESVTAVMDQLRAAGVGFSDEATERDAYDIIRDHTSQMYEAGDSDGYDRGYDEGSESANDDDWDDDGDEA